MGKIEKISMMVIASVFVGLLLSSPNASALGGFNLPGFEDWEYPWLNWETSHIDYNLTEPEGTGAIAILKTDEQGNPLANAKFKIDGVAGLYVNGKYIYSTELGLYSEFTTNQDGLAVISGLPFGTYKVTETAAPEGYAADSQTYEVVVEEDSLKEIEYGRKLYRTSDYSQEAMDFTNDVATSPEGQSFLVGNPFGADGYLDYDPSTESYVSDDQGVSAKKLGDEYAIDGLLGGVDSMVASRTDYGDGIYSGFPLMSDVVPSAAMQIKDNGDGTITIDEGQGEEYSCTVNETTGCVMPGNDGMFIRKGNNGYYVVFEDGTFIGAVFEYDATLDRYTIDPPFCALFVKEIDEDTIYVLFGIAVNYSSVVDRYMFPPAGAPLAFDELEDITATISAAQLTVVNGQLPPEGDNADGSDSIPNPQTSDGALIAMVTLAVTGVAMGSLRRASRLRK